MTDCIQCQEWELCPFHPKEKPEPARDYDVSAEAPIVFIRCSQQTTITGLTRGMTVRSHCGHYWQTWRDGKLVDEEPYDSPSSIETP